MESNKDSLYSVELKTQFLDMQGIILTSNRILFIHNYIVSVEKQGESKLSNIKYYIYILHTSVLLLLYNTICLFVLHPWTDIKLFCHTIPECTNPDTWHMHIRNISSITIVPSFWFEKQVKFLLD